MASSSKKVIYAALIGNGLIAVTKFIASFLTGSSAMLSEGIHSVVDTGNQLFMLLGIRLAKKPADERHPFGHGKEIYFWTFIVAMMIFAVGGGISLYEGIHSIMDPHPIHNPYINYGVLGLAMVFEAGAWYYAWREFKTQRGKRGYVEAVRKEKDPTTFAVLFEDSAAMLGLMVAFGGIVAGQLTGNPVYDGISSVIIGLILVLTAGWLAYETKSLLIGEGARVDIEQGIRSIATGQDEIQTVHEILTLHMGPHFILATISVDYRDNIESQVVEDSIQTLNQLIKQKYPRIKRVFVEVRGR